MNDPHQAQVDWAHFGHVMVGRAKRALSCFVMTLSYSRALYLEFFFDQTMENFLRGHVHAFEAWPGQPRVILYDNLKSAVLERRGNQILFHPAADRVERALSLRSAALPGARGQSERTRGTSHPLCARFVLGGPHLHHAGRMQSPGFALARSSRAPTALAWRRPPHRRRCLRRRTAPLAASCAASLLHRPDRDRALAQDHLCSLRSQRLLHPAGSGRTAVDLGGLRYQRAHSRWLLRDRPSCTHLRSPPARARSRASGSRAQDQAQSIPLHARRPLGASRAGEQNAFGSGLRTRRIGRRVKRPN